MISRCLAYLKPDLKNEKGPGGPSSFREKNVQVTKAFVDVVKTRIARFVFQVA
jgi:hypothetical protein